MPLFSILIPTRNRAEYVVLAVRSALNQTCADLEVIVSDNHSGDHTARALSQIKDRRLRVIRPPRFLPLADNWDFARTHATGEFVLLIGDDDYLEPDALERLRQETEQDPQLDLIEYNAAWFDYAKKSWAQDSYGGHVKVERVDAARAFGEWFGQFTHYYYLLPLLCAYRRQAALTACADGRPLYQGLYPDLYAIGALLLHSKKLARIDRPLVVLGITPKSLGPQQETLASDGALMENAGIATTNAGNSNADMPAARPSASPFTKVQPPLPGPTPANFHYEALMLLKERYPHQLSGFAPSTHAYCIRQANKLLDLELQSLCAGKESQAGVDDNLRRFWAFAPLKTKIVWLAYFLPRGLVFHLVPFPVRELLRNLYRSARNLPARTTRPLDAPDIEQATQKAIAKGWLK